MDLTEENKVRSFVDLMNHLAKFFPGSTVGEDNEGQLIIYTNLMSVGDENTDLRVFEVV